MNKNQKQTPLFSDLTQVFEDIFNPLMKGFGSYDVIEAMDSYVIHLAIPGYRKDQITIDSTTDYLIVTGENNRPDLNYHTQGLQYGKFTRKFTLPINGHGAIKANLEDGILKITIQKF
jgi:HSP20 family molecular chaperone IbpA